MVEGAIFITGTTGLVGTEVVARLLATTTRQIYVLVRAANTEEAVHRLHSIWYECPSLLAAVGHRVKPIVGDITEMLTNVPEDVTHVIHCAAETGVQKSREELWRINVEGTRNMIKMAQSLPNLKCFNYISTAYVAGTRSGLIMEEPPQESFFTHYEQSKAEAEQIVRHSGLPFIVCRPGMIVGNSETGRTSIFNTVYYILKLILQGKVWMMPISSHRTVNVVPVDYVARLVADLTLNTEAKGLTFHLTPPADHLPQVGELIELVRSWAHDQLHIDVPRPLYIPMPFLRSVGRRYNARINAKSHSLASNLTALMPYFFDDHIFNRTNTDRLCGSYDLDWRTFLPRLLDYACRHNFMRNTDQTIFQQAVVRRASKHYPITYYNITANGTERISGHEMNAIVNHFMIKLQDLGVKTGDKVALTGINCAEHAALDNAIGLLGAISVPIYYTTPADEIKLLLQKSGARYFFVGDERIMATINGIDIKVIKFGPISEEKDIINSNKPTSDNIEGKKYLTPNTSRFSTDSLATIRYTSGTTGEPKGVMFNFNQLKWMGQAMTNLLSWPDRNSEMRYLSFLPMNHVVEGILAAYAPYCMLCRAKVYYLTDFHMLTQALPHVRPTVFFSVPRFYEKLWDQIEQNPIGRRYIKMSDGWLKRLTATILRRAVLRKSGLDKCNQLLVGSAPISEELLMRFRLLGIEIHNAYGQTEAPLITLNRLGDNIIPSIGTPLPETTVDTASDGELLVRGPQVAMGYYNLSSETFKDGVLHTGDLGYIDTQNHVFISGRKKDMLITSYGKNINCTKIEQRLTDIPGVEHAVLVGEQRPYCTALLWTNGLSSDLQQHINKMNLTLSHPEQVKRFKTISKPLSITNGELTPNLKVKRNVVLQHYSREIESLYV